MFADCGQTGAVLLKTDEAFRETLSRSVLASTTLPTVLLVGPVADGPAYERTSGPASEGRDAGFVAVANLTSTPP